LKYFYIFTLIILLMLSGCGGGGGGSASAITNDDSSSSSNSSQNSTDTSLDGYLVDSPIKGVTYICGTKSETTDEKGTFECKDGPITFKVGNLIIGKITSLANDHKVYPQDLLGKPRDMIDDEEVVELSRFLQSLDDDSDISSYINITPKEIEKLNKEITTQTEYKTLSSLKKQTILTNIGKAYIPRAKVIEHLKESLNIQTNDLTRAINNEDASLVSEEKLYQALQNESDERLNLCESTLSYIYKDGLNPVAFPTTRSDYFTSTSLSNIPLHTAKNNGDYRVYSYIGEKPLSLTRYAVLGANIFKFDSQEGYSDVTNDLNKELKNSTIQLFKWLMKKPIDEDIFDQNITIVVNSDYMKSSLTDWLNDNSINATAWNITTDTSLLNTQNYDLYIAVDENTLNYKTAMENKKPVIVFQNWIIPDKDMLSYFDIKWKWYGGLTVEDFSSTKEICQTTDKTLLIQRAIKNLQNNSLNFNYTDIACQDSFGTVTCDEDLLLNYNGKSLAYEFLNGAKAIRDILIKLDDRAIYPFSSDYHDSYVKEALLLADKYRKNITYPMDKITTDDTTFYKALFSDYCISYAREKNSYQEDLGDFTTDIQTLRSQSTTSKTVSMTPTSYDEWSATGLYAIPGKTITIKRTDDQNYTIKVRFNMIRSATTKIWNQNSYSRPQFVTSNPITIEKGKTYNISTPIGGPIYVYWENAENNNSPFSLEFSNITEFPSLLSMDSDSINDFLSKITSSVYDWVDIKTPYVEIHSLKSKFQEAYTTGGYFPYNGDLTQYLQDINQYLVKNNLNLAGFKGDDLSLSSDVQNWCSSYGLDCTGDIHKKPKIQHINADIHASCGAGCSGNPYDTSWAVEPTGWGDSHEYGHNLQRARLKIYADRSTEVSNNIFPLHTNWLYLNDHDIPVHPSINSPKTTETYAILQEAIKNSTPANINHPLWVETGRYDKASERLSFYQQLVFVHRSWDIFTKLYLVERLFSDAISSDTKWQNNKDTLGFSSYSLDEAKAINGNDFMAITLSKFSDKDHKDYFNAWGIEISQKAKDQIDTNGYSQSIPLEYYIVKDDKLTKDFPTRTLPLNGVDTQSITLNGVCDQSTLSRCQVLNAKATFDTPSSGSVYFLSRWSQNGPTSSISSGDLGYTTLSIKVADQDGVEKTLYLRAAKTITANLEDGDKIAMNDTTTVDPNNAPFTSLIIWMDPNDNTLETSKIYKAIEPLYIEVKKDDQTIKLLELKLGEIIAPTNITYSDPSSTLIRSYPKMEDSSTYFVTLDPSQGPTSGVWENDTSYTTLNIKVTDSSQNEKILHLRAQRDAYSSSGDSSVKVIINSAIVYGKDNALLISYDPSDNPDLTSGETYSAKELLVIDAKLWHADKKLRERLYLDINITAP